MSTKLARFAGRYCEKGLVLTWTAHGQKGPRHAGWNRVENAITDPKAARDYWSENPLHGIAVLLAPSGLVSIDVDDEERSHQVLEHFGVDLAALRATAPCIVGRHFRLLHQVPAAELKHRTLAWPRQEDPKSGFVLFELRAGAIADTLPPSIHAGTGQPYRWENPPRDGFPRLPSRLLELWLDWPETARKAIALCPWAPPPKPVPARQAPRRDYSGLSIIAAFNQAHDAGAILEAHGYQRRDKRFAAPDSSHAAGIVLLESGKVFCHHQGDVLSGEHALDAFDVYRVLDHGGDYRSAVKAAAQALGLDRERAA